MKNCSLAPFTSLGDGKRITVAAVNDDDSGTYSDLDGNSEVGESEADRWVAERPDIDWRWHVASSAWK